MLEKDGGLEGAIGIEEDSRGIKDDEVLENADVPADDDDDKKLGDGDLWSDAKVPDEVDLEDSDFNDDSLTLVLEKMLVEETSLVEDEG